MSYDTALTLLKYALSDDPAAINEAGNLSVTKEDYDILKLQAVPTIPADLVPHIKADEKLKSEWAAEVYKAVGEYNSMLDRASELTELLMDNGICPVIFKGISAASYYKKPEYRTMGDIDFILKPNTPETFEKATMVLEEAGYIKAEHNGRHLSFNRDKVHYEMHCYFSKRINDMQKHLDEYIDSAEPVLHEIDGRKYYSYGDDIAGLIFLQHINHHLSSGLGLRQIIDWVEYADRVITDEYWDETFGKLAEDIGLAKLAMAVSKLGEDYLGKKPHKWCSGIPEETVDILFDTVMEWGNFGRAVDEAEGGIRKVLGSDNIFARLQAGGMCRWKAAQKHKILRPFAWLYQIGRGCKIVIHGLKHGDTSISDTMSSVKRDDKLFSALGIGQYQK